jgi:hypothetical protein
LMWVSE